MDDPHPDFVMFSENLHGICLIIPAYNAGKTLLRIVSHLSRLEFPKILVINDGSAAKCFPIFQEIEQYPQVTLLHHNMNRGKGAALKTGFRFYMEHFLDHSTGTVTLDSDGQHLVKDTVNVAKELLSNPDKIVLGVRSFRNVPLERRIGNIITRHIFRAVTGIDLKDTQTGLRGIPALLVSDFVKIVANKYDFEQECLLRATEIGCGFHQVPIETVYDHLTLSSNSSNFHLVRDSVKVYFVFARFLSKRLSKGIPLA